MQWLYCHLASNTSFASRWSEHGPPFYVTWSADLSFFVRNGQVNFLRKSLSLILDFAFNSAIRENTVHVLNLAPKILSSSIFRVLITFPSTIVTAVTNLCQHGNSYFVRDGSQRLKYVLKLSLHLIVSKPSMNSLFKGRQAYMTSTILSYGDLIMPISPFR